MPILDVDQKKRAIEALQELLDAPENEDGRKPFDVSMAADEERVKLIEEVLKPLVQGYLAGDIPLAEFKSQIDSINKRNEYWGFKGIKGQMFFNMIVNVASDLDECDQELKAAIAMPANEELASSRIKTFCSYIRRIGDEHIDRGGSKYGRPKIGSIPFFLSYFWQIQDRFTWPVYYTNSVNTMIDLNLFQPIEDLAADYITFKQIHDELAEVFEEVVDMSFDHYRVEHVFWFKGGNPYDVAKPTVPGGGTSPKIIQPPTIVEPKPLTRLPESYVPPIVSILPRMASNEPGLEDVAKASGTSLAKAFEKNINAAFTVLGYDTKLLGQGMGRVPDGRAIDRDNVYAILWDAKVRTDGYSMGTDDRTIREYIMTQSRELKRSCSLRNIYYFIVSSSFQEDYDDAIRGIKMDTDVNEVCLVEAEALVAMVDAKLRNPQQLSLGSDGLQRLFSTSGVLTSTMVMDMLS